MTLQDYITKWHGRYYGSKQALAYAIGMNENTLTHKIKGRRSFTEQELDSIYKVLNISSDNLEEMFKKKDSRTLYKGE